MFSIVVAVVVGGVYFNEFSTFGLASSVGFPIGVCLCVIGEAV
jgi:hypothetical protein